MQNDQPGAQNRRISELFDRVNDGIWKFDVILQMGRFTHEGNEFMYSRNS